MIKKVKHNGRIVFKMSGKEYDRLVAAYEKTKDSSILRVIQNCMITK